MLLSIATACSPSAETHKSVKDRGQHLGTLLNKGQVILSCFSAEFEISACPALAAQPNQSCYSLRQVSEIDDISRSLKFSNSKETGVKLDFIFLVPSQKVGV